MIFAIKPFEIHDGDGIRTTVFFKGCPLRCKWCHNPESFLLKKEILFDNELCQNCSKCSSLCDANIMKDEAHLFVKDKCDMCGRCESVCPVGAFEISGKDLSAEDIAKEVLRDEMIFKGSGGGVTFSGGEPLIQPELCVEIAKILKEHDINIAIDTCGYVEKTAIDKIMKYADMFLFDIKAIDEKVHVACTGVSNKKILENIKYIDSMGIPIEIRYPYIPTMNDGEAEKIACFVRTLKNVKTLRVLPYHNYAEKKYSRLGLIASFYDFPVPEEEEIDSVINRMKQCGLDIVSKF